MNIQEFFDKETSTLTYLVYQGRDAIVIDPVLNLDLPSGKLSDASVQSLSKVIAEKSLTLHWILETHAHADHITGAALLKEHYPEVMLGIGKSITEVQATFSKLFNLKIKIDGSQFDRLFADGEIVSAGALQFKVLTTPGHTPACVSYYIGENIFAGDAIFMPDSGTGRCDFPGGSATALYHSIHEKLYKLPASSRIYVGHDYQPNGRPLQFACALSEEMETNIHLRQSTTESEFVQFRTSRDQTLSAPKLLLPSIQINIDGGRLPAPEANGISYLKVPLTVTYQK
jgi:glyoxylase-like metal-dependent hydrolase (beta-lactamase superfamily II)